MQIVINFDEDVYTRLFDSGVPTSLADGIVIDRAIRTGTVLTECEDAVSREAAIKAVYGMTRDTGIDEAPYEYAEHVISDLPPVTPKPTEDAISIRKDALKTRVGNIVAYNVEWLKKHWQMEMEIVCGVKPCEDAVSREAVINTLDNIDKALDEDKTVENYKALLKECYEVLPSVTQKPKTGYCKDCKWWTESEDKE